MTNYKIQIQYDGTRYKGWQVQKKDENTIQGKLQKVLESLMEEPVEVIGSGRTDAGVHAIGQIANFHLDENKMIKALQNRGLLQESNKNAILNALLDFMNTFLPEDIAVISISDVPERFHARYSALMKTYRYRIHVSKIPNVFERRYVYTYLDASLDTEKMRRAASQLCGTHDFMSFCGNKHMKKSTVRTIENITISEIRNPQGQLSEIVLDYTGDGFLQNMVRILTGTLIEIGSGRREPDEISEILKMKDRSRAGYTVPAQGLTLLEVNYSN